MPLPVSSPTVSRPARVAGERCPTSATPSRATSAARPLLACAGVLLVLGLAACGKAPPAEEPVRAVRTLTLGATGAAQARREFPAEIRARTESRLAFRVGGKLVRRVVNLGDPVRAGQLLAELDPGDLALSQQAAQAGVSAAQAALVQAEADFKRYKDLQAQGFISATELDRREAALKSARAQADQARAQAEVQGHQTAYSRLVADVAGVVTAVEAEPGAVLAAGAPVVRVAQAGARDAVFSVPEDRIADWRTLLGRPGVLRLRLWGEDERAARPATVREVAAAADPVTRTFLVKAEVGGGALALGQTGTVVLDVPVAGGVWKLPLPALFEQQGKTAVWVVDPASMTVRLQPVTVAGAEGSLVLVSGGLAEGQQVVTAGVHVLNPGQKVRHWQAPAAASAPVVIPLPR